MRYFISAGEASGDVHGASLVRALKGADAEASFTFLGGDRMAHEAGCDPLVHINRMAYMGFSEVLRHLGDIRANLRTARTSITGGGDSAARPDAVVLIDYPSFNFRLAREAKCLGIPVFYYIPPKVWAWKEWRVRTLRKVCDAIFTIFPFETEFYRRHGMEVTYVGNPTQEEIDSRPAPTPRSAGRGLALMPGSRVGEIRNNLPVMAEAARLLAPEGLQPYIVAAPSIDAELYADLAPGVETRPLLEGDDRLALVTSGTATLEVALQGIPQVALYRANGSRLSYTIMKGLLSVSHVTLPNLIAGSEVVPEMLLHRCTPALVAAEGHRLLQPAGRKAQMEGYARIRSLLGARHPSETVAREIVHRVSRCRGE